MRDLKASMRKLFYESKAIKVVNLSESEDDCGSDCSREFLNQIDFHQEYENSGSNHELSFDHKNASGPIRLGDKSEAIFVKSS